MKRVISFLTACIVLMLSAVIALPVSAADKDEKIVRVGWYESSYSHIDQFGRRCGLVYEYQQKIAAHTGWTYEYVQDSWPNLLQMLKEGKIDLMSDVSYTEERAGTMLYSSYEMGTESYYLYIDAENNEINSEQLTTINGKKIGVNKGSIQEGMLKEWAKKNSIDLEIVELVGDSNDSLAKIKSGEIDALLTIDTISVDAKMIPVCKIGLSDFYFTVNKDRPDLLNELNKAMSRIQDEDPYFNQRIMDDYVNLTKTNAFLVPSQEKWLNSHGAICVGYVEDYLPFCALDKSTGELTGALRDFIANATNGLKNAVIQFKTVPFATVDDALEALKKGEVDCVFPVNLTSYDGEVMGLFSVAPIMHTEMSIMTRKDNRSEIIQGKKLTVAVEKGNINNDTFLKDSFPDCIIKLYSDTESCYKAVAEKDADAVLVPNFRENIMKPLETKYKLSAVPSGKGMNLSFAVKRDAHELYSILDKLSNLTISENMEYVIASYMYSNQKFTLMQFLQENWIIIIIIISVFFALLIFLLSKKLKAEKKVNEQQRQIEESLRRELQQQKQLQSVKKIAYTDVLTGVKSKRSYVEDEEKLNQHIKEKTVTEFAVVVFDLNNLKQINDTKGHKAGDQYIKDACKIICNSFKHSPIYRIGGDEFVALLKGSDYDNREVLLSDFEKQMDSNIKQGQVSIASGCACFDPASDNNTRSVFVHADKEMYLRKKKMKEMEICATKT